MGEKYCVMNVQKRKRQDVKGLQDEANRELEESKYKNAVDFSRSNENFYFVKSTDWNKSITDILEEEHIREKPDNVVLLTSVYAYSPEWGEGKSRQEILDYFDKCLEYERKTHGRVINAVVHFDETTPHMQVASVPVVDVPDRIAVPVYELDDEGKMVEKRNKKGKIVYKRQVVKNDDGSLRMHRGLNASYIVGNKQKMSRTQSEFYEFCGKPFGMQRGEVRVLDAEESKQRLSETEYKAKQIVADANKQFAEKMNELTKKTQDFMTVKVKVDDKLNAKQKQIDAERQELERDKQALKDSREALEDDRKALKRERELFDLEREKWLKTQNTSFEELLEKYGWKEKVLMLEADAERYDKLKNAQEKINGWDRQESIENWLRRKVLRSKNMTLMEWYEEEVESKQKAAIERMPQPESPVEKWLKAEDNMKQAFDSMLRQDDTENEYH